MLRIACRMDFDDFFRVKIYVTMKLGLAINFAHVNEAFLADFFMFGGIDDLGRF